jgi:cell wall-associated NlpC family hydrolase
MWGTRRPAAVGCAVVATALAITLAIGAPATAAPTFPSWGDVQKAAQNVATKKAEITKLSGYIAGLQSQAAAQGKLALQAGEVYLQAKGALDAATAKANKLESQATSAKSRAAKSKREAGQLAAQLARTGSNGLTMTLLLNGKKATNLLDSLGAMNKLGATSANVFERAEEDANSAKSLGAQARVAETAKSAKASRAAAALAMAKQAAAAAEQKVKDQSAAQTTLTAQLASLQGVKADQEAGYVAGVAWEKEQDKVTTPPKDGPPPAGPPPSAPNGSQVAGAIAFAEAQLGKPYRLDGSGPGSWDCSGLTQSAYKSVGINIGTHSATNQYTTLKDANKLVPLSERQAGDLLWYSDGGSTTASKYHVTIYIGNGKMIEAPYPGSVVRIAAIRFGELVPYAGRPTG